MKTGEILGRMKSIRQTVQISNAQKLIAASRISKARHMLDEAAPYHERIRQAIAAALARCPEVASNYLADDSFVPKKRGVLMMTSDRGLAGGYNSNLIKFTEQTLAEQSAERLMVIGQVGWNQMNRNGYQPTKPLDLSVDPPTLFVARELAERLMRMFEEGEFDCLDVVYTHFYSPIRLNPTVMRLFPLPPTAFGPPPNELMLDVAFEPSPEAVMGMLIPKYLKGFLYGCLVHAWASELASRITAMDNAISNGNEILEALSLAYNRARQASITQEITEIVAGALSLRKQNVFLAPPKARRLQTMEGLVNPNG